MPELRFNLITRDWVIIATERAKRPEDFLKEKQKIKSRERFVETCPFCPGNEDKTPAEVYRIGDNNKWQVRVTPNKFPALDRKGKLKRRVDGIKRSITGAGIHEVVIESPLHNACLALLPLEGIRDVIIAYKERYNTISQDSRVKHIITFKNHGERAGTSLEHPHSQIIGTPVIPPQVRYRLDGAMSYYDDTGECVFCKLLMDELNDKMRVILESKFFVSFIPYAALSSFHIWIFPKNHASSFGLLSNEEIEDFSYNLKYVLSKLYYGLGDPDFNYIIRTFEKNVEYFHWYISVIPRLSMIAGFELGSGMYINTSIPEESAEFIRSVEIPDLY
jgi:UDPglucose--hexose-1-phosphate uridylyltransferase